MARARRVGEFELIARYFAPLARDFEGAGGLQSDNAFLPADARRDLVVKTDTIVAGVHFLADDLPGRIAAKALRVCLSDLAAGGATSIAVADSYETFLVLREEIAQFLAANGVFRDVLQMVDMVCAQVYAGYICEQGGSYLRADFSAPEDPMQHTRRLLGLDGVRAAEGRARFSAIYGEARQVFSGVAPQNLE